MKRIITIVAAVLAVAALSVPAAFGAAGIQPPQSVFCLNGGTISEGEDMSPLLNWLPDAEPFEFILSDGTAALFRNRIEAFGGSWTFRIFVDEDPVTGPNTVTLGACGGVGAVFTDRNFWLCYSKSQKDPAVYSRGEAIANYEAGMTVPYAVQAPLSNTMIGNGMYLVCNLPAGYAVKSGVAVSTGGGEIYSGPPALVEYMLSSMPLDYTKLAVSS